MKEKVKQFPEIERLKKRRSEFLKDVNNFLNKYSTVQKDFDLISSTNECEPIHGAENSTGILLYGEAAAGAFTRVYFNHDGLVIDEIVNYAMYEFYRTNAVQLRLKHKIYTLEEADKNGLFNKGRQLGEITIDMLETRMSEAMANIVDELEQDS